MAVSKLGPDDPDADKPVTSLLAPLDPSSQAFIDSPPMIRTLYEYWDARRAGRSMPRRADIDPLDFHRHLPGIILLDVEGVSPRGIGIYRYRVVGTYEVESRKHDPTGKLLQDGYYSPSLGDSIRSYESVRRQCAPVLEPLAFMSARGVPVREDSIMLPLSEDDRTVSQILVYSQRSEEE